MRITLNWVDEGVAVDNYVVYRSLTPIAIDNLPAPLAILSGNQKTYTDTQVNKNTLYCYRVSGKKGGEEAVSTQYKVSCVPYTGPGPDKIIIGDWEAGLFGTVALGELIDPALLAARVMPDVTVTQKNLATVWWKMAYQGRVVFFPDDTLLSGIGWDGLYARGLVYGDTPVADIQPEVKAKYGEVTQNRRLLIGEHEYIVRLVGSRLDPAGWVSTVPDVIGGEYDKVYASMYYARSQPSQTGLPMFSDAVNAPTQFFTRDIVDATVFRPIVRVGSGLSGDAVGLTGLLTSAYAWRPVLELVY